MESNTLANAAVIVKSEKVEDSHQSPPPSTSPPEEASFPELTTEERNEMFKKFLETENAAQLTVTSNTINEFLLRKVPELPPLSPAPIIDVNQLLNFQSNLSDQDDQRIRFLHRKYIHEINKITQCEFYFQQKLIDALEVDQVIQLATKAMLQQKKQVVFRSFQCARHALNKSLTDHIAAMRAKKLNQKKRKSISDSDENSQSQPLMESGSIDLRRFKSSDHYLENISYLQKWYEENTEDPFPSEDEKDQMCFLTGFTKKQLNTWFANKRARDMKHKPTLLLLKTAKADDPPATPSLEPKFASHSIPTNSMMAFPGSMEPRFFKTRLVTPTETQSTTNLFSFKENSADASNRVSKVKIKGDASTKKKTQSEPKQPTLSQAIRLSQIQDQMEAEWVTMEKLLKK